jgi:hypothetical protein
MIPMFNIDFDFSSTAEMIVGFLLVVTVVVAAFA